MALISIDGVDMPTPMTYSIPMEDLDSSDSSRSESGILIRNRVRQGICRLELSWRVDDSDAAVLLGAIQPERVHVAFRDPRTGTQAQADMYVEGRSCALVRYKTGDGTEEKPDTGLWDISFNLVEY